MTSVSRRAKASHTLGAVQMSEFEYQLPSEQIAQRPVEPRDSARLLVDRGAEADPVDRHVRDLAFMVGPGDVVVMNETRVISARLRLTKDTGGAAEVLLLEPVRDGVWTALVKPSRRVRDGTSMRDATGRVLVKVRPGGDEGQRLVEVAVDGVPIVDAMGAVALDGLGEAPLPPYITERLDDPERYQTVFASRPGSVAAPTAGLHLTPELLERVRAAGASVEKVELIVGLDTFRPVMADDTEQHQMHTEYYSVPRPTMDACRAATRVVAIGTTTVRALESAAVGQLQGRTDLFITRGHDWRVVDVMMTNFHMPRSTLLVMIDAFVGTRWRSIYATAADRGYRFLSFGDAMLLERSSPYGSASC